MTQKLCDQDRNGEMDKEKGRGRPRLQAETAQGTTEEPDFAPCWEASMPIKQKAAKPSTSIGKGAS